MAELTSKEFEQVKVYDKIPVTPPTVEHYMAAPSFQPVTYNGKHVKGKVVCGGAAIDALKGFGYCKLVDESGNVHAYGGWVVDLDPTEDKFWKIWESSQEWPVKYAFCFRPQDILDGEVTISVASLKDKMLSAAKGAKPNQYVCVTGVVVNPTVFIDERRYATRGLMEKLMKEVGLEYASTK